MEGFECGLRPVGAIGAYAPEGTRNAFELGRWDVEGGTSKQGPEKMKHRVS